MGFIHKLNSSIPKKNNPQKKMLPLMIETASILFNFNQRLVKKLLRNFFLLVLQDDEVDSLRQALI
jgi:hypothetical protein